MTSRTIYLVKHPQHGALSIARTQAGAARMVAYWTKRGYTGLRVEAKEKSEPLSVHHEKLR